MAERFCRVAFADLADSEIVLKTIAVTPNSVIGEIRESALTIFPEGEIMEFVLSEDVTVTWTTATYPRREEE